MTKINCIKFDRIRNQISGTDRTDLVEVTFRSMEEKGEVEEALLRIADYLQECSEEGTYKVEHDELLSLYRNENFSDAAALLLKAARLISKK